MWLGRKIAGLVLLTVPLARSSGCSIFLAARQPGKKDLDVLQPGIPRALVIQELGEPRHHRTANQMPQDFFDFDQGYKKSTKAMRVGFHTFADVVSWGFWELIGTPLETKYSGTPVRLKVTYDQDFLVSSVELLRGDERFAEELDAATRGFDYAPLPAASPVVNQSTQETQLQFQVGYSRKIAAVIGINDYSSWPRLEGAVPDAMRIAHRLRRAGFQVIETCNQDASREAILTLLGDDLRRMSTPESLVVVYFAGHGATESLPRGDKRGYIIPADGDEKRVYSTAISMHTLRDLANRLPAKHVYYAMDSCYSGLGFQRGISVPSGIDDYLAKMTARRWVQMITAGQEGEQAIEEGGRGVFSSLLLRALEGEADFNGDGYVTASEIGAFVPQAVTTRTNGQQTPKYGTLEGTGEVVFRVPDKASPASVGRRR